MAVIWFVSLRVFMKKNRLRKQLLERGQSLSDEFINSSKIKIQESLIKTDIFNNAKKILLYKNIRGEISTDEIFLQACKRKIEVYYPKVSENHKITFNKSPLNPEFVNNKYGIPELINNDFVNPLDLSLAVIPLVGVDASGYRLGYGGGYFDRIFNSDKKEHAPITIGLGYEYQILSDEFKEPHDMRYSLVITEANIYNFNLKL